jgi:hypothetical protein
MKKMNDFLSNAGLYESKLILENFSGMNSDYSNPYDLVEATFEYHCENEESKRTFELDLDPETKDLYGKMTSGIILGQNIVDKKLNYTVKVIGKCKSCKEYNVFFLLNIFTNNPIIKNENYRAQLSINQISIEYENTNVYIKKTGASPQIKVLPNKIISKYFKKETSGWYFKGINALNENYGIGAFAYFRRIIEFELINIINDIKSLPDSHKVEIQKLLDKHNENPKVSTIYDNIFKHLPNSLKILGDNPIKILYNQTSEGLHSLGEKECLEKAEKILKLLDFVIIKINEEKSEIKQLRETIKGLK